MLPAFDGPAHRLAQPPQGQPRQPARSGHVGGRGADPPLPDQGAGGAAPHLPAVLRPLHPHGPGGQRRAPGGEAQFDIAPEGPLRSRSSSTCARRPPCATWWSPAATSPTCPSSSSSRSSARCWTSRTSGTSAWPAKGLMAIPAALPAGQRAAGAGAAGEEGDRARRGPRAPHPRQPRPAGHAAGGQGRAQAARHGLPRRAQPGRAAARGERHAEGPARALLHAARSREDPAVLLLHVRHDPQLRALAAVAWPRRRSSSTTSWATCPASPRRASSATCPSWGSAGCTRSPTTTARSGISYWTKNYRTGIEVDDPDALDAQVRVLRSDLHAARVRPGSTGASRPRRRESALSRRSKGAPARPPPSAGRRPSFPTPPTPSGATGAGSMRHAVRSLAALEQLRSPHRRRARAACRRPRGIFRMGISPVLPVAHRPRPPVLPGADAGDPASRRGAGAPGRARGPARRGQDAARCRRSCTSTRTGCSSSRSIPARSTAATAPGGASPRAARRS